jgi:hypothetical protein
LGLISEWRARCWRWGQRVPRVCLEAERIREENADDSRRWSNLHGLDKLNYRHERLSKAPASAAEDRPALRSEVVELLARLYQWRSDADRAHRAQETCGSSSTRPLWGFPNRTLNFAERLMTGGGPV